MLGYQIVLVIVDGTEECDYYIQSKHRIRHHVNDRVGKDLSLILKSHEQRNHNSCDKQASMYKVKRLSIIHANRKLPIMLETVLWVDEK
jgi:hypothetical protein